MGGLKKTDWLIAGIVLTAVLALLIPAAIEH